MKLREWLMLSVLAIAIPSAVTAQCSGTIHTISYDSTVTGTGSADPGYAFTMPKFNGGLGTLIKVQIASVVTVNFSYTIENNDTTKIYKSTSVRVARNDEITGPTLSGPITNDFLSPKLTYNLRWTDSIVNTGPDFQSIPPFYVLNHDTVVNQTFSNSADYIGTGNVGFMYKTDLGSQINGNPKVSISGTSSDMVKFILKYTYCDNIILASEIQSFTAEKKNGFVNLHWQTTNELPGHRYELEKSVDGVHFETITTLAAQHHLNGKGDYSFDYLPAAAETGKLYFRVRMVLNETSKYSVVRSVAATPSSATNSPVKLIPNPSNGEFSVAVDQLQFAGDWTMELYNIKGQLIVQKLFSKSVIQSGPIHEKLAAGLYLVRVADRQTRRTFVEKLIVH